MSESPASSSLPRAPVATAPSPHFTATFKKAVKAFKKKTKQDPTANPLAIQLQGCDSPAAIVTVLQDEIDQFKRSHSGDERLHKWLGPTINVLCAFSATLGQGVGLVNINRSVYVSLKHLFCRFSILPKLFLLAPASSSR